MSYKEEGKCPYCKSEDIDFITKECEGDQLNWYCKCNKCNKRFIEGYTIKYDGMFDEDGNELV